jgi:4-amino-4-deoxy-L-arabinose transferase-like glycosyltransferase
MPPPSPSAPALAALYALPLALLMLLIIGPMLRDGMFIDGLAYTNIARDLARGVGSFWAPTADGGASVFYGHPPLLFYLESLFFRWFGDGLYTEDLYNAVVLLATIGLLYLIWARVAGAGRRWLFFFPLLLFVLNQEVQLRYPNALLECGMTLILLVATYGFLRLRERSLGLACTAVGVGAFLAFLAKGPVGLFVLVLPAVYEYVVGRRISVLAFLLSVVSLGGCAVLLFLIEPAALSFLTAYFDHQVLTALSGRATENVAGSRLAFVDELLRANVPGVLLCLPLLLVRGEPGGGRLRSAALAVLLVAAAALLPLAVSPKQASYYQLPALPYLFLGVGWLLSGRVERVVNYLTEYRWANRLLRSVAFTGLVACTVLALRMYGTTDRRDELPVRQAAEIAAVLDRFGTDRYRLRVADAPAGVSSPLSHTLTGTLQRRHDVYHDPADTATVVLLLSASGAPLPGPGSGTVLYSGDGVSLRR